jgi:hypothetical protein
MVYVILAMLDGRGTYRRSHPVVAATKARPVPQILSFAASNRKAVGKSLERAESVRRLTQLLAYLIPNGIFLLLFSYGTNE